jgi:hypothetical protein
VRRQLAGQALFHHAQLAMVEQPGHLLDFDLAYSEQFGEKELQWRGGRGNSDSRIGRHSAS